MSKLIFFELRYAINHWKVFSESLVDQGIANLYNRRIIKTLLPFSPTLTFFEDIDLPDMILSESIFRVFDVVKHRKGIWIMHN